MKWMCVEPLDERVVVIDSVVECWQDLLRDRRFEPAVHILFVAWKIVATFAFVLSAGFVWTHAWTIASSTRRERPERWLLRLELP